VLPAGTKGSRPIYIERFHLLLFDLHVDHRRRHPSSISPPSPSPVRPSSSSLPHHRRLQPPLGRAIRPARIARRLSAASRLRRHTRLSPPSVADRFPPGLVVEPRRLRRTSSSREVLSSAPWPANTPCPARAIRPSLLASCMLSAIYMLD